MDPLEVFSTKADKYFKHRWDYPPEAIQAILDVTRVSRQSTVADIGAGPGTLAKHFIGKVGRVIAIEPNAAMRDLAMREIGGLPGCRVIDARSEATTLPSHAIDLVTVGQALNWFDPVPSRAEFLRILKPAGWLAILRFRVHPNEMSEAIEKAFPPETDTEHLMKGLGIPWEYYLVSEDVSRFRFPFSIAQTLPQFLNGLSTASYAPDEDSPFYPGFKRKLKAVFEEFCPDGILVVRGSIELHVGRVRDQVPAHMRYSTRGTKLPNDV